MEADSEQRQLFETLSSELKRVRAELAALKPTTTVQLENARGRKAFLEAKLRELGERRGAVGHEIASPAAAPLPRPRGGQRLRRALAPVVPRVLLVLACAAPFIVSLSAVQPAYLSSNPPRHALFWTTFLAGIAGLSFVALVIILANRAQRARRAKEAL